MASTFRQRLGSLLTRIASRPSTTSHDTATAADRTALIDEIFNHVPAVRDFALLKKSAEAAIPQEHRPDPDQINLNNAQYMIDDIVGLSAVTAIEENFEGKQRDKISELITSMAETSLRELYKISPDTLKALHSRCLDVERVLGSVVRSAIQNKKRIINGDESLPIDVSSLLATSDAAVRRYYRAIVYMHGLNFAPLRAEGMKKDLKAARRGHSIDSPFNLPDPSNTPASATKPIELIITIPETPSAPAEQQTPKRVKKPVAPPVPRMTPEERKAILVEQQTQMLNDKIVAATAHLQHLKSAIETEQSKRAEFDENYEFQPLLMEEVVGKLPALVESIETLKADQATLVEEIGAAGQQPVVTTSIEFTIKDVFQQHAQAQLVRPDLSDLDIDPQAHLGDSFNRESLVDDAEVQALASELEGLQTQITDQAATLAPLEAENKALRAPLNAYMNEIRKLEELASRAEERITALQIDNGRLQAQLDSIRSPEEHHAPAAG